MYLHVGWNYAGDRVRLPRRRGPLGRIFGAVGTAITVSVVTVGAMFAAAALNTVSALSGLGVYRG